MEKGCVLCEKLQNFIKSDLDELSFRNISLFKNNKYYREENVILAGYHISLGIINMLCTTCLKYVE